jgi:hypothetical protein
VALCAFLLGGLLCGPDFIAIFGVYFGGDHLFWHLSLGQAGLWDDAPFGAMMIMMRFWLL